MNISFYTASVGAQQQQDRLDVHANNIANINNYGFRAKIPSFSQLMTGPVVGIEDDLARGVGSRMEEAQTDFNPAGLWATERKLDYAIEGSGFFALLNPTTGEVSYTRDGSFTLSELVVMEEEEVVVVNDEGNYVNEMQEKQVSHWYLSDGMGRFVLGADGRRIEVFDQDAEQPIGVFDFINHDGMLSLGDNRIIPVEKNGSVGLGSGKVIQGALERSNADLADQFAKVIESQRSFQYMLKMITTSDEIETTVNGLR